MVYLQKWATTQGPLFGQVSPLLQSFGLLFYMAVFWSSYALLSVVFPTSSFPLGSSGHVSVSGLLCRVTQRAELIT